MTLIMDKWFNVGKIVNVHGLKGEVRVISTTDFVAQRFKPGNHLFYLCQGRIQTAQLN